MVRKNSRRMPANSSDDDDDMHSNNSSEVDDQGPPRVCKTLVMVGIGIGLALCVYAVHIHQSPKVMVTLEPPVPVVDSTTKAGNVAVTAPPTTTATTTPEGTTGTTTVALPPLTGFHTSITNVDYHDWTEETRTAEEALSDTYPDGKSWQFNEASVEVTKSYLVWWINDQLLGDHDAFEGTGVPVPSPGYGDDQVGDGDWVVYSRRQLCYIVAKTMLGSGTKDYYNGLKRFLEKSPAFGSHCTPRTGDFGEAMWSLLAACAADPGLKDQGQGPSLLVAKGDAKEDVDSLRQTSQNVSMEAAAVRICQYDDGVEQRFESRSVPAASCRQPSEDGPGNDFMTGGPEHLAGQAIQDISAAFIGGYIFGGVCDIGGGQDERLLTVMPEVTALTFFLSEASDAKRPQLRIPVWIVGARMIVTGLDGTSRFATDLKHDPDVPLTGDIVSVEFAGKQMEIASSRPFLAFMSTSQGFLGLPEDSHAPEVQECRKNKNAKQRSVNPSDWNSFEKQVLAWYTGVALTSYHEDARPVLSKVVHSIGSGPWGAGLWWGDSQFSMLASWVGHALAAKTWPHALPWDYYIYSAFTENPGNQCFVHAQDDCKACLDHCVDYPLPGEAFWLPDYSLMRGGDQASCAGFSGDCGETGLLSMLNKYEDGTAHELWSTIETALADVDTSRSVFDHIHGHDGSSTSRRLAV